MAWSRESRHKRGYGAAWDRVRKQALRRDKHLCQPCLSKGRVTLATEVHHIKAKADGGSDDPANLVAICPSCHDAASREQRGQRPRIEFSPGGRVVW